MDHTEEDNREENIGESAEKGVIHDFLRVIRQFVLKTIFILVLFHSIILILGFSIIAIGMLL